MNTFRLNTPVSVRSHFLHSAPAITLGSNYNHYSDSVDNLYSLHHEYLHYEDFTSLPFLCTKYFWNQLSNVLTIETFKGKTPPEIRFPKWNEALPFKTNIEVLGHRKLGIPHQLGYDVLLEASAILNFLVKPERDLEKYSMRVLKFLMEDASLNDNLVHIGGVQLIENAVRTFRSKFQPNKIPILDRVLPALIPKVIGEWTFGYSMILEGFDKIPFTWDDVHEFMASKYIDVWYTYTDKVTQIYQSALINSDFEEFIHISHLRDISIVGFYSFLNILYKLVLEQIKQVYADNQRLFQMFVSPLLNLLRLNEALNPQTLTKYGVKKLWSRWIPIPLFIFTSKNLDSVRLDIPDPNEGNVIYRFSQSLSSDRDVYALYGWLEMLFINELCDAIVKRQQTFTCPVWAWTREQYGYGFKKGKRSRDHVERMCNDSLNIDINISKQDKRILPSHKYCKIDINDINYNGEKCFFHHCMDLLSK